MLAKPQSDPTATFVLKVQQSGGRISDIPELVCAGVCRCKQVCAGDVPEPPLGEAPGADSLHTALQVEEGGDGLLQTLFILLILTLLLQLL